MTRQAAPAAESALDPERLFGTLAGARGLVLAVSGGPDSTALMVLVARWRGRPPVIIVTVDHGLRVEAADEARCVAANAERLRLPCRIMRTPERPPRGNLQDWARRARYRCLTQAANDAGYDTIVTAHHLDDQAETFLLRLARGSGVYGLAAMPDHARVDGVALVRPLLGVPKESLASLVRDSGLDIVSDPSNDDPRFDRVRMRALLPVLADHALTSERLAGTAGRLGRAAAALDHYAHRLLTEHFSADDFGVVRGKAGALADAPEEVGLRALALILRAVGGSDYTPRLDRLEPAFAAIVAGREPSLKRTLHGVELELKDGRMIARREWGRDGPETMEVSAGMEIEWDRRFSVLSLAEDGLKVGPLGMSGRRLRAARADQAILRTLPGLFRDETLIAVPPYVTVVDEPEFRQLSVACLVPGRLGLQPTPG